jgi:hypothetical protein
MGVATVTGVPLNAGTVCSCIHEVPYVCQHNRPGGVMQRFVLGTVGFLLSTPVIAASQVA